VALNHDINHVGITQVVRALGYSQYNFFFVVPTYRFGMVFCDFPLLGLINIREIKNVASFFFLSEHWRKRNPIAIEAIPGVIIRQYILCIDLDPQIIRPGAPLVPMPLVGTNLVRTQFRA
jgi:hypothetical protein